MPEAPYYDPDVRAAIEAGPALGTVNARTLAAVRKNRMLANEAVALSDAVTRSDVVVPGPAGASDVRLRVHRQVGADGGLPCVYWIHGGGYVLGSPEQDDLRFDRWCQRFEMVGVAVQYRLAPEHPYPAAINDCYAGLSWLKRHGDELGVDTSRIGIGGPSGGGGLAAALSSSALQTSADLSPSASDSYTGFGGVRTGSAKRQSKCGATSDMNARRASRRPATPPRATGSSTRCVTPVSATWATLSIICSALPATDTAGFMTAAGSR